MIPQTTLVMFATVMHDLMPADTFPQSKPLLAHYTTMPVLESLVKNNEIWLANPLFMNDVEEVRFGIENGLHAVRESAKLKDALRSEERQTLFLSLMEDLYGELANESVLDYYILCLSEHAKDDNDGMLSMWRAYGGNGSGVAVVFDVAALGVQPAEYLVLGKVIYATTQTRLDTINVAVARFSDFLIAKSIETGDLKIAAWTLFECLKLLALFSKHVGFREEREWRLVYLPERDPNQLLKSMLGYNVGPRGVEPKLKLKIEPVPGVTAADISLANVIERLILGPTIAAPIARAAVGQMLERLGHPELATRLRASSIPFRTAL